MLPVLRRNGWMVPTVADPFDRLFRGEVDGLFGRVFGHDGGSLTAGWAGMPIAVWEDEDHYFVEAELPGLGESDVDITVHNGQLFLRGERRPAEGRSYLFNNRSYGRFQRVISLPASVNPDGVHAELNGGLLTIRLDKAAEAKPRKIAVQGSGAAPSASQANNG